MSLSFPFEPAVVRVTLRGGIGKVWLGKRLTPKYSTNFSDFTLYTKLTQGMKEINDNGKR